MHIGKRSLLGGASLLALTSGLRAIAGQPPAVVPSLRQEGGRPGWQPVTNKNSSCGAQGTPSTGNPDTLSRIVKTVMTPCGEVRTVLMGFQMNPYEQQITNASTTTTGAFACIGAIVVNGGTTASYSVGTIITFAIGISDLAPLILRVSAVSSGSIKEVEVVDSGAYAAALADGTAYSTALIRYSNAASPGAGATFAFAWREYAYAANVGLEPTASNSSGSGTSALIPAGIGLKRDGLSIQTTILVPDSGIAVTDPIRIELAAGALIAERIGTVGAPPGVQRPAAGATQASDYFASASTPRVGALTGTTLTPNTGAATLGTCTVGRPLVPAPWFCIIGDSIDYGIVGGGGTTVDTGDASGNLGYWERGLFPAGFASLSITRPSDKLDNWYGSVTRRYMRLGMLSRLSNDFQVNFGSCVFCVGLGVNDVINGISAAALQVTMQQLAQDLLNFNPAGFYWTTIMPGGVTSTDGFATVANQSVSAAQDTVRKTVNTWLRGGAGGLLSGSYGRTKTGVIDRAALVEANNGGVGVWMPNLTTDGTHPTQAVHTSVLAPLVTSTYTGFALPS